VKVVAAGAVGALVLAAVAIADPGSRNLRRLDFLVAAKRPSELALVYKLNSGYLVRVDSRTLRPRGPGLRLPRCGYVAAFAPGQTRVVLGGSEGTLCLVGTRSLRFRHLIETDAEGDVAALQWAGSRILALVEHEHETLVAVDPASRQVVARRELEGSLQQTAKTSSGLVLLLGPAETIGPSRLLLFAPDGTLRVATLDRIPSGFEHSGGEEGPTRYARPALAVDQSGSRAFVVGAGTPVAEVDLATFSITYHDLSTPVSLLGKVHGWLEPAAEAKVPPNGSTREATWLGNGMLAVSGWNDHTTGEGDQLRFWNDAAGLDLIDTRDWSLRVLDEGATSMTTADGSLLASSWLWDSTLEHPSGTGLTAYGPDGGRRFHLFGSRAISSVEALGNRAFIRGARSGYSVVDLTSARVLHSFAGEPPVLLLP
jgi:hypothetical protein